MRPVIRPAPGGFQVRHLAALVAPPVLALACVAAVPHAIQPSGAIVAPGASQAPRIELAGNKGRDSDDNFDPYGKDDPTSKKWGTAAGLLGNRYGGMRTGGDPKGKERSSDRDDREPRAPRGEERGRK